MMHTIALSSAFPTLKEPRRRKQRVYGVSGRPVRGKPASAASSPAGPSSETAWARRPASSRAAVKVAKWSQPDYPELSDTEPPSKEPTPEAEGQGGQAAAPPKRWLSGPARGQDDPQVTTAFLSEGIAKSSINHINSKPYTPKIRR